ncbi:hypothetical protein DITRI_Ditri03aG0029500 [Diplodiscus trichospermus]
MKARLPKRKQLRREILAISRFKEMKKSRREIQLNTKETGQVFELHRLIKDTTYLGKLSFKRSPAKKLPLEFVVKPLPHTKHKDDAQKPSYKMECSAENAVGTISLSSVKKW